MIEEQLKENASLYVAGALPVREAREFEEVLGSNLELQLLVQQLRESMDALVVALPRKSPPPALRARLLRQVELRAAEAASMPATAGIPLWQQLLPWALAACLTFLCVFLLAERRENLARFHQMEADLADRSSQLEEAGKRLDAQKTEYQAQRDQLNQRILQQGAAQLKQQIALETKYIERLREVQRTLTNNAAKSKNEERPGTEGRPTVAGGGLDNGLEGAPYGGIVATNQNFLGLLRPKNPVSVASGAVTWETAVQRGLVIVDNLEPLPPDQVYQLWVISDEGVLSAGVLPVDDKGRVNTKFTPIQRVSIVQSFAISVEARGGAATPSDRIVMASN